MRHLATGPQTLPAAEPGASLLCFAVAREFRSVLAPTDADSVFSGAAALPIQLRALALPLYEMSTDRAPGLTGQVGRPAKTVIVTAKVPPLDDRRVCVLLRKADQWPNDRAVRRDEIGNLSRASIVRTPGCPRHAAGLVLLRSQKVAPAQGPGHWRPQTDPDFDFCGKSTDR